MKAALAIALIAASATSASALTTKYTSELEPYTTSIKAEIPAHSFKSIRAVLIR